MASQTLAIRRVGLVTSVGLSAPATCAAIRAKISNPTETRFMDSGGEWIMAHQVPLKKPWRGLAKLAKMAAMAIAECLEDIPREKWASIPLLLCVAEPERPGRVEGLDDQLFRAVEAELGASFAKGSAVIPHGRISVAVAAMQARELIHQAEHPQVLVAATDSLLTWPTLRAYEAADRLLRADNSNGLIPGEAAGAILLTPPSGVAGELTCTGIGLSHEQAHIDSELPFRAEGLATAIKSAVSEAGIELRHMDFRITDISGEQYYFKEAALALSRTLRHGRERFDVWHPAESTGEVGASSGTTILALAKQACEKRYSIGPNILAHMANDAGQRAAMAIQHRVAP